MIDLRKKIEDALDLHLIHNYLILTQEERNHIISISESIIRTRDNIHPIGGGFVQSIINNDLSSAINRADLTCYKALKFLVYVKEYINK